MKRDVKAIACELLTMLDHSKTSHRVLMEVRENTVADIDCIVLYPRDNEDEFRQLGPVVDLCRKYDLEYFVTTDTLYTVDPVLSVCITCDDWADYKKQ